MIRCPKQDWYSLVHPNLESAFTHKNQVLNAGRILKGEKPVDLPVGQQLDVELAIPANGSRHSLQERLEALQRISERAISGLNIPGKALRREDIYDEDRGAYTD